MIRTLLIDLDDTLISHTQKTRAQITFTAHLFNEVRIRAPQQGFEKWQSAWRSIKDGALALKTPAQGKTNQQRMTEALAHHLHLDYPAAEQLLLESLDQAYPSLKKHFSPISSAAPFLEWAKEHYTLILATNPVWPKHLVETRMRWGNIKPEYFKSITTFDHMTACKPNLQYYREILAQENLDVRECMMIGNEVKMDLPASKVGIQVFLVDHSGQKTATHGTFEEVKTLLIKQS